MGLNAGPWKNVSAYAKGKSISRTVMNNILETSADNTTRIFESTLFIGG